MPVKCIGKPQLGPRGGYFYINSAGNKVYCKLAGVGKRAASPLRKKPKSSKLRVHRGCVDLSHLKKYSKRASPPYPAKAGQKKKGRDGLYFSKPDKNGVHRWQKIKATTATASPTRRTKSRSPTRRARSRSPTRAQKKSTTQSLITQITQEFGRRRWYDDTDGGFDRFALTWKDFVSIIKKGKQFWVLEPQEYSKVTHLDGNYADVFGTKLKSLKHEDVEDLEEATMFYESSSGLAVTGGGADSWVKVSAALLKWLKTQPMN